MGKKDARNYPTGVQAKVRGTACILAIGQIAPDPRNHNVMTPMEYTKLVESIRQFGFVDPLLVREKKGPAGQKYETINGEHRWRAVQDLGLRELPCINLGEVSDVEAEQLAVVTNESGGASDQVRLAERLRRISDAVPFDRLVSLMPYSPIELKAYLDSVDFSFAHLSPMDVRPPKDHSGDVEKKRLSFELPAARADKVLAVLEKVDTDHAVALEKCVFAYAKAPGFKEAAKADVRKVRKAKVAAS